MPLREFFHLMHMVDDFDAAEAFFTDLFGMQTFMAKSWSDLDKRWASLARVGEDFVLELMEASKKAEDAGSPLPKFQNRFGQHFHSLSWLVDASDMQHVLDDLRHDGVRVVNPQGEQYPLDGPAEAGMVMFTHPKDTFGQIELMAKREQTGGNFTDPLFEEGWSADYWRDDQPLGILRTSHMTVMVRDLDRAKHVFGLLGGAVFHEATDDEAEHAYVFVGKDTVVDLARPTTSDSRLAKDLEASTELPHSVTFAVRDLDAVAAHASKLGVGIAERTDDTLLLEPADTFDAVFAFTTASIPNDPRD
jgi:catechol 2,3-dioxygenase-like lactoylglutathione lyase family enzyme